MRTNPTYIGVVATKLATIAAKEFAVSVDKIYSRERTGNVVDARMTVVFILVKYGCTISDVAAYFRRHHSTFVKNLKVHKNKLETEPALRNVTLRIVNNYTLSIL